RILYSSAKRIIPSLSESPSKRPRRSPSPPANIFTIKGCQWLLADSLNSYQPARREATNKYSISAIKCTDCDVWFLVMADLLEHLEAEHDILPFRCSLQGCNRSYRSPSSLAEHTRLKHRDDEDHNIWRCNKCRRRCHCPDCLR